MNTEKEKNNEFDNNEDTMRFPINFKVYNTPVSLRAFSAVNNIAERVDIIHSHGYPVYFSDISTYVGLRKKVPLVLHWVVDPRQAVIYEQSRIARVMNDAYFRFFGNRAFEASRVILVPSENYKSYLVGKGVEVLFHPARKCRAQGRIAVGPPALGIERRLEPLAGAGLAAHRPAGAAERSGVDLIGLAAIGTDDLLRVSRPVGGAAVWYLCHAFQGSSTARGLEIVCCCFPPSPQPFDVPERCKAKVAADPPYSAG